MKGRETRRLPYIEKAGERGDLQILVVDGAYIRSHIDEEFTNYGQHYRFSYIPIDELWLDREAAKDEQQFFIDHLLVEHRLMAKGMSYEKALSEADRARVKEWCNGKGWQGLESVCRKRVQNDAGHARGQQYCRRNHLLYVPWIGGRHRPCSRSPDELGVVCSSGDQYPCAVRSGGRCLGNPSGAKPCLTASQGLGRRFDSS
jgi:hypothetical protein